jgi:predicted secreted protein
MSVLVRTCWVWVLWAMLGSVAQGQEAQGVRSLPVQNTVHLSAQGAVEVQQDWLHMVMTTTRDGGDALAVQTQLKQALDAALAEAKKAAAPGQLELRTGSFSLYPRYGRDGKINGWQGSTELVLEGRDFARIGATAGKVQTLTLGQVSLRLSRERQTQAEAQARDQAVTRFKSQAQEVARSFGFAGYTLGDVAITSGGDGEVAPPRAMLMMAKSGAADAPVPVEAGRSTVQVTVAGTIQLH